MSTLSTPRRVDQKNHARMKLARAELLECRRMLCAAHLSAEELATPIAAATVQSTTCNCNGGDSHTTSPTLTPAQAAERSAAILTNIQFADVPVAAAGSFTATGQMRWTDRDANIHAIPLAYIEIREQDPGSSTIVGTGRTNLDGRFTISFTADDGPGEGNPDLFARVYASSLIADIVTDSSPASTYFMETAVTNEVAPGSTVNLSDTGGNFDDNETAFGIHHALVMMGAYAGSLAGAMPSHINVHFPTTRGGALFDSSVKQIHLLQKDRFDWDVIAHEYGHYFQSIHGFQNNPGGAHGFGDNLAQRSGSKDAGNRLAWGEGWATFFGLSGLRKMGASSLGMSTIGNTAYDDTENQVIHEAIEAGIGVGEDNELSVAATLWDIFDAENEGEDKITISDKVLFDTFKAGGVKTFGEAWSALASPRTIKERTELGALLGEHNIAPVLLSPEDGLDTTTATEPPEFKWKPNGGGSPNPLNDFRIVFYDSTMTTAVFQKELGNVQLYKPTPQEWGQIQGSGGKLYWVIEGRNTSSPATPIGSIDHYWSAARAITPGVALIFVIDDTGSMGEEIGAVKNALNIFIDSIASRIPAGAEAPRMQLITFKDEVIEHTFTTNLDTIRSVIGAMVASQGGDCPEASMEALGNAVENIGIGGTIILATDATSHPSIDPITLTARMVAKDVQLSTILTGECGPVESSGGASGSAPALGSGIPVTPEAIVMPVISPAVPVSGGGVSSPGEGDGDDFVDPPQTNIDDPGQAPIDLAGDSFDDATRLEIGVERRGTITPGSPEDFYVFDGASIQEYAITVGAEGGQELHVEVYYTDRTTILDDFTADARERRSLFTFTPGQYYIRVRDENGNTVPYTVGVALAGDPLSTVKTFSTMAAQTGGTFAVYDEVNTGDASAFEAAVLNSLFSTLGPAVVNANTDLPRGQTIGITLTGRNTSWRDGVTTVEFAGGGITVNSVDVTSPTSLTAIVTVSADATVSRRDVTVRTPVGSKSEEAIGLKVTKVTEEITVPTTLSVEPGSLKQGETRDILIRGVATNWDNATTLTLGAGVTINSITVLSPTLIQANVTVAGDADVGFRTATVTSVANDDLAKTRAVFINGADLEIPQIVSVSPGTLTPGAQTTVTITGENTHFATGVTTVSFGNGVNVVSFNVVDATTATAVVEIAAGASSGFRNILVTTGSESAAANDAIFVESSVLTGISIDPVGFDGNSINEGGAASFVVTAHFSDNSTQDISGDAGLSSDLSGGLLINGQVFAPLVSGDTGFTLSANYNGLSATRSVTVVNTSDIGGSDLSGAVLSTNGISFIGGRAGRANITIGNAGPDPAIGILSVNLYLSSDGVIDASDTILTTVVRRGTVPANRSIVLKTKFVYPSDKLDGQYQLLAQIDNTAAIAETSEANNVASLGSPITLTAPFVDFSSTMTLPAGTKIVTGRNTKFDVTLTNNGNVPVTQNSFIRFVASTDATLDDSDITLSQHRFSRGLGPDRTKRFRGTLLTRNLPAGEYHIFFVTDATGVVAERNEANNSAVSPQPILIADPFVDLAPSNLRAAAGALVTGRNSTYTFDLKNDGNVPVGGRTKLRLVASSDNVASDDDILLSERVIGLGIRAGATKVIRTLLPSKDLPAGTYHFIATLDPDGTLTESNESNNVVVSAAPVVITDPFVDLQPTGFSPSGSTLPVGRNSVFSFTLLNNGNIPVGGSTLLRVVASTDATLDDADTILRETKLGLGIRAGATKFIRGSLPIASLAAGTYYLFAVLDPANTVIESVESNNTVFSDSPITIG